MDPFVVDFHRGPGFVSSGFLYVGRVGWGKGLGALLSLSGDFWVGLRLGKITCESWK